ncbi:MAG: hypothetical protein DSM106950_00315 [Stigonema ocellatum SAG 48.90 = DSM 106950]|nr:hypothetical protein [Stigonema ocellatum SAG 48.90 = DSM 106950]
MSNFQKNDRVVVTGGEYSSEHGKVVDGEYKGFLFHQTLIQLDKSGQINIPVGDLEYENLRPDEVTAVIKNVKNQVEQVASQLPGEMGKELPNHVGYLGIAIVSNDKLASKYELDYVMNNLKKASEVGSVTPEWMETTRIDLEKINWTVKHLS